MAETVSLGVSGCCASAQASYQGLRPRSCPRTGISCGTPEPMLTAMTNPVQLASDAAAPDPEVGLAAVAALRRLLDQLEALRIVLSAALPAPQPVAGNAGRGGQRRRAPIRPDPRA